MGFVIIFLKNYYQTLGVTPQASRSEIKLAYRRLALKYHPDKTGGDLLAEAAFKEVKEAYDVLNNAEKKQQYKAEAHHDIYYKKPPIADATILIKHALHLKQLVSSMDPHRVNEEALMFKIESLLSAQNFANFKESNDENLVKQFITALLYCCKPLQYNNAKTILLKLAEVAANDAKNLEKITAFKKYKWREALWNRYKIYLAVLLTLLLCFIIYKISVA